MNELIPSCHLQALEVPSLGSPTVPTLDWLACITLFTTAHQLPVLPLAAAAATTCCS